MSALQQVLAALKASVGTSMLVAGAGTGAANGTYTLTGTANGKNYYNLSGTSSTVSAITWSSGDTKWYIYSSAGVGLYQAGEDVATPNLVTTWALGTGANPVPTVTLV